ncbi:MAG: hypothetical protein A3F77_14185 [Betaproteobacteria bacterium RIFCSPLOWO2_12_FULL_67_28]|nr:MAG: hypothetical protein A3I65_02650 [Betaproteobacteria bacterium RIFCSPLOWO2_02_FULL_68_150]OGA73082.1 MAG: hypothetical protein A3F77_14185 [Betaproteobacteria bacterium RIFCSPLOWO2_12_FULL_67_28]
MSEEQERFLQRWSRRKVEAREAPPAAAEVPEPAAALPAADAGAPLPLPCVEQLTPESDFRPFMDARVEPATRRAALKRLFADAHFNVPDSFEAYAEDYTGGETIPEEMLKTLNQARRIAFDEPVAQAATEPRADAPTELEDGAGKQDV